MWMTTHITQLPSSIGCLMKNSAWTQWSGSRLERVHRTLQTYYRSISRNIGQYSLPKNLPKSHPLTYIPIIGTTLVAIWQLGSPSGPSKPEKHHRHQRQLDLPPSFFFGASLTVSERVHAIPFLLKTSPGTPGQFPTAFKRNTIQYAQANGNVSGERQFSTEKIAPYWEGAALAMQRSEDCLVDAVLCTWNWKEYWHGISKLS